MLLAQPRRTEGSRRPAVSAGLPGAISGRRSGIAGRSAGPARSCGAKLTLGRLRRQVGRSPQPPVCTHTAQAHGWNARQVQSAVFGLLPPATTAFASCAPAAAVARRPVHRQLEGHTAAAGGAQSEAELRVQQHARGLHLWSCPAVPSVGRALAGKRGGSSHSKPSRSRPIDERRRRQPPSAPNELQPQCVGWPPLDRCDRSTGRACTAANQVPPPSL